MPRSSRIKSAETRQNVMDAAYRLFIERGYSATSLREISRAAGVTVGAIYNHFATKEDIWLEVLLANHPLHQVIPVLLAARGDSLDELVRSTAHSLVNELMKRKDVLNLMLIEIVEFNGRHVPVMVDTFLPKIHGLQKILAGKPDRLREIPLPTLLRSFGGLFFSFYITSALLKGMPGIDDDPAALDRFVDLYLYGILDSETHSGLEAT